MIKKRVISMFVGVLLLGLFYGALPHGNHGSLAFSANNHALSQFGAHHTTGILCAPDIYYRWTNAPKRHGKIRGLGSECDSDGLPITFKRKIFEFAEQKTGKGGVFISSIDKCRSSLRGPPMAFFFCAA